MDDQVVPIDLLVFGCTTGALDFNSPQVGLCKEVLSHCALIGLETDREWAVLYAPSGSAASGRRRSLRLDVCKKNLLQVLECGRFRC